MDKFDKIVMLIEHGFTKNEIDKILPAEVEPEKDPEPVQEPAAPVEPVEPAPEPVQEPAEEEPAEVLAGFMSDLKTSVDELKKAVQAGNVNKLTTSTTTAEDMNAILASYINPPRE